MSSWSTDLPDEEGEYLMKDVFGEKPIKVYVKERGMQLHVSFVENGSSYPLRWYNGASWKRID